MDRVPGRPKKIVTLMGADRRARWVLLIILAAFTGVVETMGAFLIFGLLGLVMSAGEGVEIPVLGNVRGHFPEMSDSDFLIMAAVVVTAFFIFRAVTFLTQSYLQNRIAHNAGVRLATGLFDGYLRMPYPFHLRRNSAELIRNANHSVLQIVSFAFVPIVLLGSEVLVIVGIFVALVVISPGSTLLLVVVAAPVVAALVYVVRRGMRSLGAINQEMSKTTLQVLQESLQSVRDIQILHKASYFGWRFARSRAALARALYLRGVLSELPRVATETLLVVLVLVFLIFALRSDAPLDESLASLGLLGYSGVRILPSLSRIVANLNNLQFAGAAVDDVYEQVKLFEATPARGKASLGTMAFSDKLVARRVGFAYDEEPVLVEVDFVVERGGSLGIVGSTGAGKSTLIDIVMALLEPTTGTVEADGVSVHENPGAWHAHLGVVPQSVVLIDDSLRRNIAFGVADDEMDERRIADAIQEAQLSDFVASLPNGLETQVGESGVRLSGGQRQRVAIARALYRDPDVLIFDEATSALDNVTEAKLIEGLRELRDDRTVIMVAHRLTTVKDCEKILVLDAGRVVDTGTYSELLERNPMFQATRG